MIPFSSYMYEWLYGDKGYYVNLPHIGKKGDFYTSVSTSMFFGGCIANHLLQLIDEGFLSPKTSIIEIGAHKGYLLADMVQFIFTLQPELLKTLRFFIVEPLKSVQKAQKEYFNKAFKGALHVEIVDSIQDLTCKEAFIVANELFDAFICEVIFEDKMLFIENHQAHFQPITQELQEIARKYNITKGEIPLGYEKFSQSLCNAVEKFEFLSFDYGDRFPRDDISLRIYKKHQTYPFFELTSFAGEKKEKLEKFYANSDITYDVCFNILIDSFMNEGAKLKQFSTQMVGLNDFGLTDLLNLLHQKVEEKIYLQELEKAKQLILPNFLGERFKMIRFQKG